MYLLQTKLVKLKQPHKSLQRHHDHIWFIYGESSPRMPKIMFTASTCFEKTSNPFAFQKKTSNVLNVLRFMSKVVHEIDVFHVFFMVFSSQSRKSPADFHRSFPRRFPTTEVAFVMLNCGTGRWYAGSSSRDWLKSMVEHISELIIDTLWLWLT